MGLGAIGLLLTTTLAAGCSGDSDSGGGASSVPIDDVPALYAAAACKAFESCVGSGVLSLFLRGESCTERTTAQIADSLPKLKEGIDKKTVAYDGTKVKACVAAIEALGCAVAGEEPAECTAALDGTLAVGSDCSMDAECAGADTYCKTDASCPGKCAPRESVGGPCQRDDDCAAKLSCDKDKNVCFAPAALGAACGGGGKAPDCELGTFCIGSEDQVKKTGTCKSLTDAFAGKEGDACYFADKPLCAPDLRCIVQGAGVGGIDAKCGKPYASGAACQLAIPDACPTDEYCKVPPNQFSGTCTPRPKAGEPCAKQFEEDLCAANTRCDNGTCRPLQALGGQCAYDAVCYSENCAGGNCVVPGGCK
jgi:hypothetical protein